MKYGRRNYRRKTYRRKTYRKRWNTRSRYNKKGQRVMLFTRFTSALGAIICDGINPALYAFNFSLSDLPNYTEFTNLYDNYKINAVKVNFYPKITESVSTGSVNNPDATVRFLSVIDYNDSTPPLSVQELRDYKTCKASSILRPKSRYIYKPKIVDSSSTVRSAWIATSSPSTNWFGLKVAIDPTTTAMTFGIEAKYYCSFKNVK